MTYLADEEKRQQEQNPEEEKSGDIQKTGDLTPTVAASPAQKPTQLSTGMKGTQAQKYVKAHQAPKLAERILGKLKEKESTLKTGLETEQSNIEQQTGFKVGTPVAQQTATGGQYGELKRIQATAPEIAKKSSAEIQAYTQSPEYQDYLKARDFTPQEVKAPNIEALSGEISNLRQTAAKGQTEAGRFGLLRDIFGRKDKDYTQGQQSLDQLLLQQAPGESAKLAGYAKTAGADLEAQAQKIEPFRKEANTAIETFGKQLKADIAKSATDEFGNVSQNAINKLMQYNQNKERFTDILSRALSGQEVNAQDSADFMRFVDTNPEMKKQLLDLSEKRMYNTPFINLVQGGRFNAEANRMSRTMQPGESTEDVSGFDYKFGQVTPEEIRTQIAKANLNDASMADRYKFISPEDIAKQQALESLYGEIGQNYLQSEKDRISQNLTPEQVTSGIDFQQYLTGRKGYGDDPNLTLGLGYEGRANAVEDAISAGGLRQSADMSDWFYNNLGAAAGYGNTNEGAGNPTRDAVANANQFLGKQALDNPQLNSMSPEQLKEYIANNPTTIELFGRWDNIIKETSKMRVPDVSDIGYHGEFNPELYSQRMADLRNQYADQIIAKRNELKKSAEAMRGTQFTQLRRLFGLQ